MHIQIYEKSQLLAELDYDRSANRVDNFQRYTDSIIHQPFGAFVPTGNHLLAYLESRCWDRNRYDLKDILDAIGVYEYDPIAIVKKTHGLKHNDYYWIKFDTDPEDLCYDKIKIRD